MKAMMKKGGDFAIETVGDVTVTMFERESDSNLHAFTVAIERCGETLVRKHFSGLVRDVVKRDAEAAYASGVASEKARADSETVESVLLDLEDIARGVVGERQAQAVARRAIRILKSKGVR